MKKLINYLTEWQNSGSYGQNLSLGKEKVMVFKENNLENLLPYLKVFTVPELFPKELTENQSINEKTIVYILGLYLYYTLTKEQFMGKLDSPNIKKIGIYQFLIAVLKKDTNKRKSNIPYLLSLLNKQEEKLSSKKMGTGYLEEFSTVGLIRDVNQDFHMSIELSYDTTLLIVADGMGGGEDGDVASKIAIETSYNYLKEQNFGQVRGNRQENLDVKEKLKSKRMEIHKRRQSFLVEAVAQANTNILKYAEQKGIISIGSTLSIALVIKNDVYIGHIGDSRVSMRNNGQYKLISKDQSQVAILLERGSISKKDVDKYPKNVLMYVLGTNDFEKKNVYLNHVIICHGGQLILSSDGFWDKVPESYFHKDSKDIINALFTAIPNDNATFIKYTHTINETSIEEDEIDNFNALPFNEIYEASSKEENSPSIIKLILMLIFIFLIALALALNYYEFFDTEQGGKNSSITKVNSKQQRLKMS